jgi:phosphoglycerol transferase MdoB-like AlkP superfamily enzyme
MRRRIMRWLTSPVAVLVCTVLVTVLVALGANLSLELWSTGGDIAHLGRVLSEDLSLFFLGSLVVWLFVLLVVATLGRLWPSVGIIFVVAGVIGYADYRKVELLTEPLYPADLVFRPGVGFLTQMVGAGVLVGVLLLSTLVLATAVLLGRWLGRRFRLPDRRTRPVLAWTLLGGRLAVAVTAAVALSHVMQFHDPGNSLRSAYDRYGAHWRPWHQTRNYEDNGVVAGLLYNLPMPAMAAPRGYSAATMRRIVARYSEVAREVNRTRDPDALQDVNVISVLSEAFSDPTRFRNVKLAEDPIPYTRELMARVPSGRMLTSQYGGGTANVEFSVMTGMSTSQFRPQVTTPFQMLVPNHRDFPSAVRYFESQGLTTTALHSYTSALYRRTEVYPILGFDDIAFREDMSHRDRIDNSRFISDQATFDEVVSRVEKSPRPMFFNVVTMQNHYPQGGQFRDPIPVTGMNNPEDQENLEHYARGLAHSDRALAEFLRAMKATGEKNIVLLYGDHLPAVWHHTGMPPLKRRETPFFVYRDFGRQQHEALPTTSPIYMMNHVLEAANAPVTPYYALLGELEQQVPAMAPDYFLTASRTRLPWDFVSSPGRQLMRDYRLVLYDLAVGRRYTEQAMFGLPDESVEDPGHVTQVRGRARGGR